MKREALTIRPNVEDAIQCDAPVVALESTIITHGMPYPTNLETALEVEGIVRASGAIPATIGIIAGDVRVGLKREELERLAREGDVAKVGARDMSFVVARQLTGGTTVSSTLEIADAAGIRVLATGGIGGVSLGGGESFDVSADLQAIANCSCITVCSGAKAFMDIRATLEYLETHHVPVVGYRSRYFPWFFAQSSGQKLAWIAEGPHEVASFFRIRLTLGQSGGVLVGVPIQQEKALPKGVAREAIRLAYQRVSEAGIKGSEVTPFLLSAVNEITEGRSLKANIALIKNNARVGSEIATALSEGLAEGSERIG